MITETSLFFWIYPRSRVLDLRCFQAATATTNVHLLEGQYSEYITGE